MSPARRLWAVAPLLGSAVFLAALPALHAYQVPGGPAVVLGAAAGSCLVSSLAVLVFRLRAVASYLLSLIGLAVLLLLASGAPARAVATAITSGPDRILTETLPLSGGRVIISGLAVLVWVCGATTSEWVLRTRRPTGLLVPVGLYVLSFGLAASAPSRDRFGGPILLVDLAVVSTILLRLDASTPGGAASPVGVAATAAAATAAAAAVAAAPAPPDGSEPGRGRASSYRAPAAALLTASAVVAVLTVLASAVPSLRSRPASLRRAIPTLAPAMTDPVGAMAQLRDAHPTSGPTRELTVTLSAGAPGYLGMAYLDDYDGAGWRFDATFDPTGGRIPSSPPAPQGLDRRRVTQQVHLLAPLPIALLPGLDRPTSVQGFGAVVDPVSGMLLPQASSAGYARYRLVSDASTQTLLSLPAGEGLDRGGGLPADTRIPPDTTRDLATTIRFLSSLSGGAQPAATTSFLQAVVLALHDNERRADPTLPSPSAGGNGKDRATSTPSVPPAGPTGGTTLSQVINAVTVDRAASPEQFATLFAMVARYLGVPARLVTGFRLAEDATGRPIGPGTYQVTNRQAWSWVEIPVDGLGWVVCDPTPDATVAASAPPPETLSSPATTVPLRRADVVPRSQITGGHALAPPARIRAAGRRNFPAVLFLVWVLAVAALALLAVGPGQAAFRRRRRRRHRRSVLPDELAVGAWLELLDGLDRAGAHLAPAATASEVATEVGHHFGAELVAQAASVAATADRAVFSARSPVPMDEARAAWNNSMDLTKRVMAGLDVRQRLRSSLLVGSAPSRPSTGGAPPPRWWMSRFRRGGRN